MAVFLIIISMLTFIIGLLELLGTETVFQQIAVGIIFIISAILFSSGVIVATIDSVKSKHTELLTQIKDELRKSRLKKYPENREVEK